MAGNNKRAIIVGIPGVGKTTVIARAAEMLSQKRKTTLVTYGTLMFEEAQKTGVKSRDEMRKLPVGEQRRLQETAARRIADMKDDVVIVDTHLFISTGEGYYPGLPMRLLTIMNPTNLIMVAADPQEIADRRKNDTTRQRDETSIKIIEKQLDVSEKMLAACSVITGAPFQFVVNTDGGVDEAAAWIVRILTGDNNRN